MAANTRFPAPTTPFCHSKNIFILFKRIEKSFCMNSNPTAKNFCVNPNPTEKSFCINPNPIKKSFCMNSNPAPSLFSSSLIAPKKEGLLRKENFKHWLDKKSDT